MASLIVMNGPKEGDYYPLCRGTNVIGRHESNPVQIIDSHISRKHIQIRFNTTEETYSVIDMSSKHGIFVNRIPIKDEAVLKDDDLITIGKTDLLFTLSEFKNNEDVQKYRDARKDRKKIGEKGKPTLVDGTTIHLENKTSKTD